MLLVVEALLKERQGSKSELEDVVHVLRSELTECGCGMCVVSHDEGSARLRYESQLLNAKASYELTTRDGVKYVSKQLGAHVETVLENLCLLIVVQTLK